MEKKEGKLEKRWLRYGIWITGRIDALLVVSLSFQVLYMLLFLDDLFLSFMYWLIPMDYNFSTAIRYQNWSTINASYAHSLAILAEGSILFPDFFFLTFICLLGCGINSFLIPWYFHSHSSNLSLSEYSQCFSFVWIVFVLCS